MPAADPGDTSTIPPLAGTFSWYSRFANPIPETFGEEASHALRMKHGVYAHRSVQCRWRGVASGPICGGAHMSSAALEKHYRVRELALLWGFSDNTIIRIFANEPGVIRLESGAGKRKYITLS